jgi:hypothetical protein
MISTDPNAEFYNRSFARTILEQTAEHGGYFSILHESTLASVSLVWLIGNDHGLRCPSGSRVGVCDRLPVEGGRGEMFGSLGGCEEGRDQRVGTR